MVTVMYTYWFGCLMYAISGIGIGVALAIIHERYDKGIRY